MTKPRILFILRMLLALTSFSKVRHFGELDPLKDIKYGNQVGFKTVKICTPRNVKVVILETQATLLTCFPTSVNTNLQRSSPKSILSVDVYIILQQTSKLL